MAGGRRVVNLLSRFFLLRTRFIKQREAPPPLWSRSMMAFRVIGGRQLLTRRDASITSGGAKGGLEADVLS